MVDWPFQQDQEFGHLEILRTAQPRVCCYVPGSQLPDASSALRSLLRRRGRAAEADDLELTSRSRSAWETAFHHYLRPVRTGRLLVRPRPCAEVPREGEIVVDLEPGLAFGTGGHPTTRMALAGLERLVQPGDRVLDFGTGSGVLACAAAQLGAAHVMALDIDPQAVQAARRNVALNRLSTVSVVEADTPPAASAPYDVVVANISAGVIVASATQLGEIVRPGGHCLLGGIIAPQLSRVLDALAATSLRQRRVESDGEWRSIHAARATDLH
jgi:ribosomal protein L11 methyltransferase